uniref:CUE domain containing 1 n=1 Tax=Buteo japonicus TaxID=224669 RepID=A0A8C0B345_9AVES
APQAVGSPPAAVPWTDVPGSGSTPAPGRYRNWNPPLLGNLPEDFLRILPQQTTGTQVRLAAPSSLRPGSVVKRPSSLAPRGQGSLEQERRWKQYLEDERIALFLQNEEFMKELQRNRDFLLALERDRLKYESKKSKSTSVAVSNDFGFSSVISGNFQDACERRLSAVGRRNWLIPPCHHPSTGEELVGDGDGHCSVLVVGLSRQLAPRLLAGGSR